eukprot:CAMPEP_0178996650 /NCGR_PEP_ID=MMETSP0795-20121207/8486_1 /TAXON_ID=88552 /ORGANISM="Amoebophrya sp., Strain Ameob2" /LENGTH=1087 /DNA_ID=CAMNT_0020689063 /DNA_START=149 /DNA_END=3409 /DNA_ORIENTATION=+
MPPGKEEEAGSGEDLQSSHNEEDMDVPAEDHVSQVNRTVERKTDAGGGEDGQKNGAKAAPEKPALPAAARKKPELAVRTGTADLDDTKSIASSGVGAKNAGPLPARPPPKRKSAPSRKSGVATSSAGAGVGVATAATVDRASAVTSEDPAPAPQPSLNEQPAAPLETSVVAAAPTSSDAAAAPARRPGRPAVKASHQLQAQVEAVASNTKADPETSNEKKAEAEPGATVAAESLQDQPVRKSTVIDFEEMARAINEEEEAEASRARTEQTRVEETEENSPARAVKRPGAKPKSSPSRPGKVELKDQPTKRSSVVDLGQAIESLEDDHPQAGGDAPKQEGDDLMELAKSIREPSKEKAGSNTASPTAGTAAAGSESKTSKRPSAKPAARPTAPVAPAAAAPAEPGGASPIATKPKPPFRALSRAKTMPTSGGGRRRSNSIVGGQAQGAAEQPLGDDVEGEDNFSGSDSASDAADDFRKLARDADPDRTKQDLQTFQKKAQQMAPLDMDAQNILFGDSAHEREFNEIFQAAQERHKTALREKKLFLKEWEDVQLSSGGNKPLLDLLEMEALFEPRVEDFPKEDPVERCTIEHGKQMYTKKKWFGLVKKEKEKHNEHALMAAEGTPLLQKNEGLRGDVPGYFLSEFAADFAARIDDLKGTGPDRNATRRYALDVMGKCFKVVKVQLGGENYKRYLQFREKDFTFLKNRPQDSEETEWRVVPYKQMREIYVFPQGERNSHDAAQPTAWRCLYIEISADGEQVEENRSPSKDNAAPASSSAGGPAATTPNARSSSGSSSPAKNSSGGSTSAEQQPPGIFVCFATVRDCEVAASALVWLNKVGSDEKSAGANAVLSLLNSTNTSPSAKLKVIKGADLRRERPRKLMREGFGRKLYADMTHYCGEISAEAKRHGRGVMYSETCVTTGYWDNDLQTGPGTELHLDGTSFTGMYSEDRRNGYGMMQWDGGAEYQGVFVAGKAHGAGILIRSDKSYYVGQFEADTMHGQGEMIWGDGTKYVGQFSGNKRHGVGIMAWASEKNTAVPEKKAADEDEEPKWSRYYGEWVRGKQEGIGVLLLKDGTKCPGMFHAGQLTDW